jgi:transposase
MSAIRKTYTEEFKRQALSLLEKNGNKSQVARDLGVHVSLLRKWHKKISEKGERPFPGKGNAPDDELSQLKRENARLKEENEILKKTVGIFSSRPRFDTVSSRIIEGSMKSRLYVVFLRYPQVDTTPGGKSPKVARKRKT